MSLPYFCQPYVEYPIFCANSKSSYGFDGMVAHIRVPRNDNVYSKNVCCDMSINAMAFVTRF
jgi:hypothetical protein